MEVKLFIREDCPSCPAARAACEGIDNLSVYDIADMAGIAETASCGVQAVPTVVVLDSAGREVAAWRGTAPVAADLRKVLAN